MDGVRGSSAGEGKALRRSARGPFGWLGSVGKCELTKRLFRGVQRPSIPSPCEIPVIMTIKHRLRCACGACAHDPKKATTVARGGMANWRFTSPRPVCHSRD
jgi:hypothetical protein